VVGRLARLSLLIAAGLFLALMFPVLVSAGPPIYHDVGAYEIHDFYVRGVVHYNVQLILNSAGGAHWRSCVSHNLVGVGLTTGRKYQVVSAETRHCNMRDSGFPYEWTYIILPLSAKEN